jgi:ribosome biogenesis GTPase / thiamine phosphate phosphatase
MIDTFGWSAVLQMSFAAHFATGLEPARVIAFHRERWVVVSADGERDARLSGKFILQAKEGDYPVVGDWVGLDLTNGMISGVLPRSSAFRRRAAGGVGTQTLCANVEVGLLVMSLNGDLNPRRLERYLAMTRDSGARPVVVLTKVDLEGAEQACAQLATEIADVPLVALSAMTGAGIDLLWPHLRPAQTAVLLGSSGAGKSTLLNRLLGYEAMATGDIRAQDDRGRHTTRHRAMFRLANGALLIDTPGMRELGLVGESQSLANDFGDVTAALGQCRFSDCGHTTEPGCGLQLALTNGELSEERWQAYLKLKREQEFEARRVDKVLAAGNRKRWKRLTKDMRARSKHKEGGGDRE